MKKMFIVCMVLLLVLARSVKAITCDATPASTTIELGSSKKVTISCSDWGSVTSVVVEPTQYNPECLSLDKSSETITQGVTKDFTITATSMACNPFIDDRTIVWKFTPNTGTVPSKSTVVTVESGLVISATFKQAPYSATQGSEVTIILEVSTTANEDINNININMSQSDSSLGLTNKQINKIAASQGEKTQQVSWTITAPTAGTYTIKAVVTSQNADSDTATTTLTVAAPSEELPPSGPAGGVAPTRNASINTTKGVVNITIYSIRAGHMANVSIEKTEDMPFTLISIQVNNSANFVKLFIRKLDKKPAEIVHEIVGKVYHYIKIDKSNIQDKNVKKVKLRFRVEKSWINENNIDVDTIALYRYTNKWEKLNTVKISEDSENVYFEAESPGLSVFAIAGEEKVAPTCVENWSCTEWSECINGTQTRTCTDLNNCGTTINKPPEVQSCKVPGEEMPVEEKPPWLVIIGSIVALVIMVGILIIYKKQRIK